MATEHDPELATLKAHAELGDLLLREIHEELRMYAMEAELRFWNLGDSRPHSFLRIPIALCLIAYTGLGIGMLTGQLTPSPVGVGWLFSLGLCVLLMGRIRGHDLQVAARADLADQLRATFTAIQLRCEYPMTPLDPADPVSDFPEVRRVDGKPFILPREIPGAIEAGRASKHATRLSSEG